MTFSGPYSPPTLHDLADLTGGHVAPRHAHVSVHSASISSQDVAADGLFCAVPGTRTHGATFASSSGAAAVLTDARGAELLEEDGCELPVLIVDDVRKWMGPVAAEVYGHPAKGLTIVGITGTSGKTTTSYLVERALMSEHHVGIIGTTGTRINGRPVETKLTTPEAPTMQALLRQMRDESVTHVVMEVSSHALQLGRVRGIPFDVVAFTNLSQDHLDFHPTMEDYFQAKRTLFVDPDGVYGANAAPRSAAKRKAVVCIEDVWGQRLASETEGAATVSATPGPGAATWNVEAVQVSQSGRQDITLTHRAGADGASETINYSIGLAGSFNVANSVIAIACATAAGVAPRRAAAALADVQVPGRMQAVDAGQDFLAVVDYAHKPGAVAAVLGTLSDYLPSPTGRIAIVLGAGGNRDRDKRPKMGHYAAAMADAVFITDDNPRDEDPQAIRAEVLAGAREAALGPGVQKKEGQHGPASHVEEIADRARAIAAAVAWAQPGDAIVIAGKGHEKGQEIRGVMHEFDDQAQLTSALNQRMAHNSTNNQEKQP
ncbi:UDP-N-acetylmuramoyl-L-alanyl-D-glutamate--2,6-diaminopimelate ligase [Corynebacterium heidelbergense]|uniref:UDP-N-acetylmuramoyl-L-alanyl-D-glutamate--2,6-diaminopimelate ligase n=1 Tax=Corynebacterium heidelbergense TaxID=2055947 RepID=A0A364V6K2_9CORY|nr:UDP-N-acetylmuramoyl-L-alanyl-D-glutamate--2,6-diaminopimelate ligase [Corynebacterium heidelbergense]RAV32259.1 UDP-N-acetylmuramoyl-L-alanyl-D-glutamate--2,6-diaminopimelate ligase [Corynebacterium heidelbergense]